MDKEIPGRSKCCKGEDTDEIKIDGGKRVAGFSDTWRMLSLTLPD